MNAAAGFGLKGMARTFGCVCTVIAMMALLPGCSGSTGPRGATGATGATGPQGSTGATGPVTALNVSTAKSITATITAVTLPTAPAAVHPVVKFQLVNETGEPLSGLPAGDIYLAIAKLVPAGTRLPALRGQTSAPAPSVSDQWQSYIYQVVNPASPATAPVLPVVGTTAQPQATIEYGGSGKLVDNGDGTYQYTFAADISSDSTVTYDPTLTHRVGFEIRGLAPANSPVYTFQPSTGATSNITTYDLVDDKTCTNCHNQLAFHGGARTEVKYCVVCHNPSSVDPSSGNTLDFKVMFHKIHMGADLPSVMAGGHYYIFGYQNAISDFSDVAYPQADASNNNPAVSGTGQRFCATCHNTSDTQTPQAGNFASVPSSESCGACHDNVNFVTGQGHSAANIIAADTDCVTCHGPTSTINNGSLQVVTAHQTPVDAAAAKFAFNIVSATNTAPGQTPSVTIKVTDPTNNNAAYNINQAGGPFKLTGSALRVDFAWNTTDWNNVGTNSATATTGSPNQPIVINFATGATDNGNGTFTATAPAAIPTTAAGSGAFLMEGRAVVPLTYKGVTTNAQLGITGADLTVAITDTTARARRQVVDINKCNNCHRTLTLHGQNRTNDIQLCTSCHNPDATDIVVHAAASGACAVGTPDNAIDFKYFIHELHASGANNNPITICGFGNSVNTFNVGYPGALNDCTACHNTDTYYPVDPNVVQGTTVHAGASRITLTDDTVISPNTAVCSACHIDSTSKAHMVQNGGDFNATKTMFGTLVSAGTETCSLCHGPGAVADVKVMHSVASFNN